MAAVPPVTFEEIDAVSDLAGVRALSKKFYPPVPLNNLSFIKKKERLKLAVKKHEGKMKNVDALGEMMKLRREEDRHHRETLVTYFTRLKTVLSRLDTSMRNHLERKQPGMEPEKEIDKICHKLETQSNKLIVAGETSSGKSTLLNIFLNESLQLPVKLLSCTATVCEMTYSDKCQAFVVYPDREEEIPFDKRDEYIYKESERESRFDHEIVRLKVPSFFLKTGVTLVDTPGVSEGGEMGSVLKDYVLHNEPFGFVFTIDSSRAGGVLQKNILLDLSTSDYVDDFGQRKLDAQSCIFVANKWDIVEDRFKEETKQNMCETLSKLPCMKNFNPDKQLFFMDADFAHTSRVAGYISDDFSKFIDGLNRFVQREQRRKLKLAYGMLQSTLKRLLHPLRSYIQRMQQNQTQRSRKRDKITRKLVELEKKFQQEVKQARAKHTASIEHCSELVLDFLKSEKAIQRVTEWRSKDVPKQQYGDNWVIMEIKLDEVIDERFSEVLREWEEATHAITNAEHHLLSDFMSKAKAYGNELEEIELNLRNESGDLNIELQESNLPVAEKVKPFTWPNLDEEDNPGERQFDIRQSKTWGYEIMAYKPEAENLVDSITNGPVMRVLKRKKSKEKSVPTDVDNFVKDKVGYMRERASKIFATMCNIDYATMLVTRQLQIVEDCIFLYEKETSKVIGTNKQLLDAIAKEKRKSSDVCELYGPIEKDASDLLEEVLKFEMQNIKEGCFRKHNIEMEPNLHQSSLFASLCRGNISLDFKKHQTRRSKYAVTIKVVNMKPSQIIQQELYLRKYATQTDDFVQYLGLHNLNGQYRFVLRGQLITARQYFTHAGNTSDFEMFLAKIGTALQTIHLKNLVHTEISLDSILMKEGGDVCPLLSNLLEPSSIDLPSNKDISVGGYVSFPSEVLHGKQYTWQADMYGLGIIMMELAYNINIFSQLKSNRSLKTWIHLEDQGHELIKETSKNGKKISEQWKSLATKCLKRDPSKRNSMATWQSEWMKYISSAF